MKCDAFVTHFVQVNHTNVVEEARQPGDDDDDVKKHHTNVVKEARQPGDDDDDVKKHGSTESKVEAGSLVEEVMS